MQVLTRTGENGELSYLQAKGSSRHIKESEGFITRAPSSVIHFGKDHPRVCSLISRGGSVIKALFG